MYNCDQNLHFCLSKDLAKYLTCSMIMWILCINTYSPFFLIQVGSLKTLHVKTLFWNNNQWIDVIKYIYSNMYNVLLNNTPCVYFFINITAFYFYSYWENNGENPFWSAHAQWGFASMHAYCANCGSNK